MGLDQNMYAQHYIGNKYRKKKDQLRIHPNDDDINEDKISSIKEEIGEWRKFNALHGWMVQNIQDGNDDCKDYYVSKEKLEELLDILQKVKKNHNLATTLLPCTPGFFFGFEDDPKEDYGKYYFENVEETIEIIKKALNMPNVDIIYSSSW